MLNTFKTRFAAHPERHAGLEWETVEARLIANESAPALDCVDCVGGCCGCDPSYVRALAALLHS